MYWRLSHKEYENRKGQKNKEALQILTNKHLPLGVLAFHNDLPVGWCSVSPTNNLIRLKTSRFFKKTENDSSAWSITCLFIHRDYRNQGLSVHIISAAAKYAFANGASYVEAYPILPKKIKIAPAFAWVGFANSFKMAGFRKKVQVSENRVVMELTK